MQFMRLCGILLLSLLTCMVSVPAVAQYSGGGQWTGPYFASTGQTAGAIVTTNTTGNTTANIGPASWLFGTQLGMPSPLPGYYYGFVDKKQTAHVSGAGTYTITYIYKGYYSGMPIMPPASQSKVYLKEFSSATWTAYGYSGSTLLHGSGKAANGRNDPVILNDIQTSGMSSGTHLLQRDGSSGQVQFEISPFAMADLDLSSIPGAQGWVGNLFVYQPSIDTRSVTIVCHPLEDGGNFHKGANNLPEANLRNSDGSMSVDSIPTGMWSINKTWQFVQSLYAPTTGFDLDSTNIFGKLTNTQFDWTPNASEWSPATGPDNIADTDGIYSQLPALYTSHVKVTDLRPNLSATAENDYTIHIHAPFENGAESAPRAFDHNEKYAWTDIVDGNSGTTVQMVIQQPRQWTLMGQSLNNVAGSVLAGVCGSGLVVLLAPDCPPAAAVVADMVFNVIGWAVINAGNPEATLTKPVTGNYAAFTQAISEQQTIDANQNNPNLNDLVDCPDDTRIFCPDLLQNIVASPLQYWNYGVPKGKCHNGERYIKCTVTGDGYGTHGYTGRETNYPVIPARHLNDVWQWTCQSLSIHN